MTAEIQSKTLKAMIELGLRLEAVWTILPGLGTEAVKEFSLAIYFFKKNFVPGKPMPAIDNMRSHLRCGMEYVVGYHDEPLPNAVVAIIGQDYEETITNYQESFPNRVGVGQQDLPGVSPWAVAGLKKCLQEVQDGLADLPEFLSRLAQSRLTPEDLGETMETIRSKAREGSIKLGKEYVISVRKGRKPLSELRSLLERRNLTFADLGESEESFTSTTSS